jgi:hypothetical protein
MDRGSVTSNNSGVNASCFWKHTKVNTGTSPTPKYRSTRLENYHGISN